MTPEEIRDIVKKEIQENYTTETTKFREHIEMHLNTLKASARAAAVVVGVFAAVLVGSQSYSIVSLVKDNRETVRAKAQAAADQVVYQLEETAISLAERKILDSIERNKTLALEEATRRIKEATDSIVEEAVKNQFEAPVQNAISRIETASGDSIIFSKIVSDLLPLGTILPWSIPNDKISLGVDALNTILASSGWRVCDGRNGTPDLNDRFLMGTTNLGAVGQIGGNNAIPTEGEHSHGLGSSGSAGWTRLLQGDVQVPAEHSHSVSSAGSHNHGGDNRPNYYTVVYIMRVATVLGSSSG